MLKVSDRKVILYRFKFNDFVFDRSFMKICFKKKIYMLCKNYLSVKPKKKKKQGIVWYEVYFYLTIIVIFLLNLECFLI